MRHLNVLLVVCLLSVPLPGLTHDNNSDLTVIVREFVAAFNAHDSIAMSKFVAEDVQWLSISGDSVSIETDGKPALISAMDGYFQSCPTCRSHIREMIASGERVSAIEEAVWEGRDGPRTQRSLSVYEFSGQLIRRVYYFPAER
jgi:hypothetical protein